MGEGYDFRICQVVSSEEKPKLYYRMPTVKAVHYS